MKRITAFCLMAALLLLVSCQSDYDFLNKTFYGDLSSLMPEKSFGQKDASIHFSSNRAMIDGKSYQYQVMEETKDYILIQIKNGGEWAEDLLFRYIIKSGDLLLLRGEDQNTIKFMTQELLFKSKLESFSTVKLESDISHLSDNQKQMLSLLFDVAEITDKLFWIEAYGDKAELMQVSDDENLKQLFEIHYGPWERLNNDAPLLARFEAKYPGANFYPQDMTIEEFENFEDPDKKSLYTLIRRDENGNLTSVWYHEAFEKEVTKASELLIKASELAEDEGFKLYLQKRAEALLTDDYYESDVAWMQMKNNLIDFVTGPIENYEDKLFNYKAAHESFILIKDREWSDKLNKLASLLPMLQKELPVPAKFKQETPGTSSDLNVYDAVFYAGDCNAGSKTIAINLPNDPKVRQNYGSRKLQLKNSIRYKFENILVPISNVLISEDQRQYIDFNAFFENTMFHEVAHGLGLDYTINGKGPVREALKEAYSAIEEGKADILGLYIVTKLTEMGELNDDQLMDNYVTFMAGIFRSVRFGASSAHGKANMIRFSYFKDKGAFSRDEKNGTYSINFEKMRSAMTDLTNEIIAIQGLGEYEKAASIIKEKGIIGPQLQKDLDRLNELNIPVDLVFEQGKDVLGI